MIAPILPKRKIKLFLTSVLEFFIIIKIILINLNKIEFFFFVDFRRAFDVIPASVAAIIIN